MADAFTAYTPSANTSTVKGFGGPTYQTLMGERHAYWSRAIFYSSITDITLFPQRGTTWATQLPTPFQPDGMRCVGNLASKLTLAILPPNVEFFRFSLDPTTPFKAGKIGALAGLPENQTITLLQAPAITNEIEEELAKHEQKVSIEIENTGIRVQLEEVIRHLIVAGNACLYINPKHGRAKMFRLDQYVVKRDHAGNVICAVIREQMAYWALPRSAQEIIDEDKSYQPPRDEFDGLDYNYMLTEHDLYTCIRRVEDSDEDTDTAKYEIWKEINGTEFGTRETYSQDSLPYLFLYFKLLTGESYGRSRIEQYLAAFVIDEGLTEVIAEAATMASLFKWLVSPTGLTNINELRESPNGAFVLGREEDVHALQANKGGDLKFGLEFLDRLQRQLQRDFMIFDTSSITRDRFTAEEARLLSKEVDAAHGGIYTHLSATVQRPIVRLTMIRLKQSGEGFKLGDSEIVNIHVITGIEALGRGNEFDRIMMWAQGMVQVVGPDGFHLIADVREFASRLGHGAGVDVTTILYSREKIDQNLEQQRQMALAQKLGPNVINQAGNALSKGIPQAQPQPVAPQGPPPQQ